MCELQNPIFQDPDAAREYLEAQRWPDGPACPHCGEAENWTRLKKDGKARPGVYQCNSCREQFTVTVGTVFERSKVPLNKWLLATYLMCSSKKGISAKQLERTLGVTYKTAWFMAHRIREAMRELNPGLMGGDGGTVEIDETFWGGKKPRWQKKGRGFAHKEKILTLVERNGRARSFHIPEVSSKTLIPILRKQIAKDTNIMSDEGGHYTLVGCCFETHQTVKHGLNEYVRGDVHTNTIEGYFSILKRGLNGVYQHCSSHHLKRYVGEYDFRYNYREKLGYNDMDRTNQALKGIDGKRLTYGGVSRGIKITAPVKPISELSRNC